MKALLITASVATLSSTAMATELDKKVPYPRVDAGFIRQVIHLPKQDAGDAFKIKIIAGRTLGTGCNQQRLGDELEEHTLEGWGYSYYRLDKISGPMSTMIVYPDRKKEQRFIPVVSEGFLLRYNSKLPIVVYASKNIEIRYRIWSATEKVKKAISE